MRAYELMVIIDGGLDENAVEPTVRRVQEQIAARDGEVQSTDRWGKRRFAYEINHRSEGYYLLLEITAGIDAVAELDRGLRLTDEVVRHKIVRLPEHGGARVSQPSTGALAASGPDHERHADARR